MVRAMDKIEVGKEWGKEQIVPVHLTKVTCKQRLEGGM
jgi:hypothetical protein